VFACMRGTSITGLLEDGLLKDGPPLLRLASSASGTTPRDTACPSGATLLGRDPDGPLREGSTDIAGGLGLAGTFSCGTDKSGSKSPLAKANGGTCILVDPPFNDGENITGENATGEPMLTAAFGETSSSYVGSRLA